MGQWKEIVILTELDPDRLADFAAAMRATLDVWADAGLIGDVASWAVYTAVEPTYLFEL